MIALNRFRNPPIGLQLGARSATLVQLAERGGEPHIETIAHGALPARDDSTENDLEAALALRRLVEDHEFQGRRVVSCLSSQDLFVQNVRLPQIPSAEIEQVLRHEADERLPYPVADAEVRHLVAGKVRQDGQLLQEVILLASPHAAIERHIRLLEQAKLKPVAIDVEACATLRALRRQEDRQSDERCAYLTLSENATTIIFSEGDQILFLKNVSSGGERLDAAVAKHLDVSPEEASRVRASVTAASALDTDDEIHRSVIDAIRGPLESVVTDIELCLRYYKVTLRGKPFERVVVTGSEASRWLADYLGERLGTPCELGDPFAALGSASMLPAHAARPWLWAAAVGLSMKGGCHHDD